MGEIKLGGFWRPDLALKPGERVVDDLGFVKSCFGCLQYFLCPPCSEKCRRTALNTRLKLKASVQVLDARKKELEEGLSKREFFEKYGFVLMPHKTQMTAEDWLYCGPNPPVLEVYSKEIDPLLRELVDVAEINYPSYVLRRGPGGPNNFFGTGVHQDFGLYPEDMRSIFGAEFFDEWFSKLDSGGGYSMINFWRPVLPMVGPVRGVPLAVCDPNTISVEDIVPQEVHGFVPGGQYNMGLKFNPKQQWYFYPEMTKDEVLIFRQFHYQPKTPQPYSSIKTVFHSAFRSPWASKDEEVRCSSEYRVPVWLK
ncbi:unnamed protein product [Effrenium voratum]|uniref:Uncharacterized protein n=2 Tax=Effrenium voratum TaxID=2562239 RepID=A0AA36N9F6_9DINO|nr:unnamed protein product [Effrenium voratum]CAJ1433370.1 unnamed protein product [Effrenium voratum]